MSKYEIMFILRSDIDDELRKSTVKTLEDALTDNKATITLSRTKRICVRNKENEIRLLLFI